MPVIVINDEKPTFIAKPDMRFATSFLSLRFRDYAVKGESLMDKATGELYCKRKEDGRVVSFFQNKKFLHELMLEAYVLTVTNPDFTYPRTNDKSYFLCTDYDSMSLFEEKRLDILTQDAIVANDETDTTTQFKFHLSDHTNGFFFRATSRDCDKSVIEFLTSEYNHMIKDYSGDDEDYLAEQVKGREIEKWYDSNAIIEYTVKVTKGDRSIIYTDTDYIRINERCCVFIPYELIQHDFPNGSDSVLVTIKSVHYDKIHFMINHLGEFSEDIQNTFNTLRYPDNEVYIDFYNVEHFIDSSFDILPLGNEFFVAFIDTPYFRRYVSKMSAIKDCEAYNIAIDRPDEVNWHINSVWGERVRSVYNGGYVIDHDSETNIHKMEAQFGGVNWVEGAINTDPLELSDFYIRDARITSYSRDQVLSMVNRIKTDAEAKLDRVVVKTEDPGALTKGLVNVTNNGVVLRQVKANRIVEDE